VFVVSFCVWINAVFVVSFCVRINAVFVLGFVADHLADFATRFSKELRAILRGIFAERSRTKSL